IRDKLVTGVQTCALPIYLRSITRLTRDAANLYGAVGDFAHFQFKKATDKIRMAARDNDLRTAQSIFDGHDIGAEAIAHIVIFDRSEERRVGKECRSRRLA